jgi:hypothetical protein
MTSRNAFCALLLAVQAGAVAWADAAPRVTSAWARATPPGLDVGAAYLVIEGGERADRLVAASTARASMVELHAVEDHEGVARMRELEAIDVPAGARVELAPGATHLMLMGLDAPLVAGQVFPMTLRFALAGEQTVSVRVQPATAAPHDSQPPRR